MKSIKIYLLLLAFCSALVSCEVRATTGRPGYHSKPLPPGQAKKLYNTKSAKPFAPGHNK